MYRLTMTSVQYSLGCRLRGGPKEPRIRNSPDLPRETGNFRRGKASAVMRPFVRELSNHFSDPVQRVQRPVGLLAGIRTPVGQKNRVFVRARISPAERAISEDGKHLLRCGLYHFSDAVERV